MVWSFDASNLSLSDKLKRSYRDKDGADDYCQTGGEKASDKIIE